MSEQDISYFVSFAPQSVVSDCLVLPDWAALPDSGHWIQAAASGLRTPSPRVPTYFTQTRPKLSALQRFIPRVLIIILCDHATLPLISSSWVSFFLFDYLVTLRIDLSLWTLSREYQVDSNSYAATVSPSQIYPNLDYLTLGKKDPIIIIIVSIVSPGSDTE